MASVVRTSKLTAPAFDRLARTPCPIASLASSGINALSSLLARSWSRKASRVLRKSAAKSAQEFDALIADRLDARPWRFCHDEVRDFAGLDAAPELLFGRDQDAEGERVHRDGDLGPFAAGGRLLRELPR